MLASMVGLRPQSKSCWRTGPGINQTWIVTKRGLTSVRGTSPNECCPVKSWPRRLSVKRHPTKTRLRRKGPKKLSTLNKHTIQTTYHEKEAQTYAGYIMESTNTQQSAPRSSRKPRLSAVCHAELPLGGLACSIKVHNAMRCWRSVHALPPRRSRVRFQLWPFGKAFRRTREPESSRQPPLGGLVTFPPPSVTLGSSFCFAAQDSFSIGRLLFF